MYKRLANGGKFMNIRYKKLMGLLPDGLTVHLIVRTEQKMYPHCLSLGVTLFRNWFSLSFLRPALELKIRCE